MDSKQAIGVYEAFGLAWRLRKPFLLSHLAFNVLLTAVLTPLMALVIRVAIAMSGKPALSDFDIAFFLLSPTGFMAFLIVASLSLSLLVMDTAFMMAIAMHDRQTGQHKFHHGLLYVFPRVHALAEFGGRLVLKMLVLTLPFLLLAGLIYQTQLTHYDINYYLSQHPPEFLRSVAAIGAILAIMALVVVYKLLGWAVALPMVLFAKVSPKHSFRLSEEKMAGERRLLFVRLIGWGITSTIIITVAFSVVGWSVDLVLGDFSGHLKQLVRTLLVFGTIWGLLNLLVTTMSTGALANLLMAQADWPGVAIANDKERGPRWLRPAIWGAALLSIGLFAATIFSIVELRTPDDAEVIAHRGAAGARPENTMASIQKALDDQADWVEIDVQETVDGEVVVIHDSDFMKIAGVDLKIWDATMQDLEDIDIGSWYAPEYSQERTPTLRQVLDAAKGRSGVLIELKYYGHDQQLEQRVSDIVEAAGMSEHVKVMSLKYPAVQKMKNLRPEWDSGLLASASVGRVWELDVDFLAVNTAMLSTRLVREMRERGKKVYVWTVNDPLSMTRVLSMGASGVITDEPAMAHEVIRQRAELSSPERLVLAITSVLGVNLEKKVYRDTSP